MTDNTSEEPIKRVGAAGKVMAADPTDSSKGYLYNNGIVVLKGSDGSDVVMGSKHDDIVHSNGAENKSKYDDGTDPSTEVIIGKDGYDTAVLQGLREDYIASIPETGDYPSLRAPDWKDTDTLYGKIILLENVETGEKYSLNGVESVVFDHGQPFAKMKDAAIGLGERIKDGSVTSVSTEILFKQAESSLDPEDIHVFKIHASQEMSQLVSEQYKFGMDIELLDGISSGVVDKLDAEGIDVDERPMWKPDAPEAEITTQTYSLGMESAPKI